MLYRLFRSQVAALVDFAGFIESFYNTWLFRIERASLHFSVKQPSADTDVHALAHRNVDHLGTIGVRGKFRL